MTEKEQWLLNRTTMRRSVHLLLPFILDEKGTEYVSLLGRPQRPFRPLGLAVYEAGNSEIECFVGRDLQASVSYGRLPAKFFNSDLSFEQIQKKLDEGIMPPNWVTWDHANPGVRILLRFYGATDAVKAVMWGEALL